MHFVSRECKEMSTDTAMLKVEAYRYPRIARESGLVGLTSDPCHLLRSGGDCGFAVVA